MNSDMNKASVEGMKMSMPNCDSLEKLVDEGSSVINNLFSIKVRAKPMFRRSMPLVKVNMT